MDLKRAIRELYAERDRVLKAIAHLETLRDSRTTTEAKNSRRGRKSMGAEERREVSERMKKFWAKRWKSPRS